MPIPPYVVFTDLDGTLLDHHTYSYQNALPGLRLLQEHGIPIVFCSAKTRTEELTYREALNIHDPFIVENGAAIFVERRYFREMHEFTRTVEQFEILEFARPYSEIRRVLVEVREELNLTVQGYGDLEIEEVARLTELDAESAARAMQREYAETVVTPLDEADRKKLEVALARHGVRMISGARFLSVSTANDKGRAVKALADLFRRDWGAVVTVGIGDSWNDTPMLQATDIPVLVQRPEGSWAPLPVDRIRKIAGVGPQGWTQAMRMLISDSWNNGVVEC